MIGNFNGFYKGKKVLITGHTGFKGSWMSIWLGLLGAEVIGYALPPDTHPNLFTCADLQNKLTHIEGDIRDKSLLLETIKKYQPDIVLHLAAQALVRLSYKEPLKTIETNVMGTVNLLEAVRKVNSVKVLINITSDKCYENKEWDYAYRENDPMGGYDPYSASKGCSELLTCAYRRSFFNSADTSKNSLSLATARAGNVIGGGDWARDRIIPDCIRKLSNSEETLLRNPQAVRPWQHVLEPLSGYLILGEKMYADPEKYAEAWNFGPYGNENVTVEKIVGKLIENWGKGSWRDVSDTENFHEAGILRLDSNKAMARLNWQPLLTIDKAVQMTVNWYKSFYEMKKVVSKNVFELCHQQIKYYTQEARKRGLEWAK